MTNSKRLSMTLALVIIALLFLSCASSSPNGSLPTSKPKPSQTPTTTVTEQCANPKGFVALFFHRSGSDGIQCVTPAQLDQGREQVTPPVVNVYLVCAGQYPASISYASYEDPVAQSVGLAEEAFGGIAIEIQADSCETIHDAVDEDSMSVTSVWINPFYGERGDSLLKTENLIHQVPDEECARRSEFFTVWYADGQEKACFANAGFLRFAHFLRGVVKVCSGSNTGGVMLTWSLFRGLDLYLGAPQTCVFTTTLLKEGSISINGIDIAPPGH